MILNRKENEATLGFHKKRLLTYKNVSRSRWMKQDRHTLWKIDITDETFTIQLLALTIVSLRAWRSGTTSVVNDRYRLLHRLDRRFKGKCL
jgi:hypothetical protein